MKKNSYLEQLGKKALIAANDIVHLTENRTTTSFKEFATEIKKYKKDILKANKLDIKQAEIKKIKAHIIERSILNHMSVKSITVIPSLIIKL